MNPEGICPFFSVSFSKIYILFTSTFTTHQIQFCMSSSRFGKQTKADQKIPRFLFGRIKWLLSQSQTMLPETIKKKKSTNKGESNQSSAIVCQGVNKHVRACLLPLPTFRNNRETKSWVCVKFQANQMRGSALTFVFTILFKNLL